MEDVPPPKKKSKACLSKSYSNHCLLFDIFQQLDADRKCAKVFCDICVTNHSLHLCAHKCILWISGCFKSILALEYIIKNFSELAKYVCEAFLELVEAIYKFGKVRFSFEESVVEKLMEDLSELKSYLDLEVVEDLLNSKSVLYISYEEQAARTRKADDYKPRLIKMIQCLDNDRSSSCVLCDAKLDCGDEQFNVHKCIVGCASQYFKTLFTTKLNEAETIVFDLKTVDTVEMKNVLDYVYACDVILTEDNVYDVTASFDYFMLPKLKDLCSDFLCASVTQENFNEIYSYAEMYCLKVVLREVAEYYHLNLWQISDEDLFRSLTLDALRKLTQVLCHSRCEEVVFAALLRWLKHDLEERRQYISVLTELINYDKLSLKFLKDILPVELHFDPTTVLMLESLQQQVNPKEAFEIYFASNLMFTNDFLSKDTIVLKYDISKDKWHEVGSCAPPVCEKIDSSSRLYKIELSSIFLGAYYYVIGVNGRKVFRLCVTNDELTWVELAPMLEFRSTKAAAALLNKIYVCGGIDFHECAMSSCECYDTESDKWHRIAPLLDCRCFHSMVASNQHVYVFGGTHICDDVLDILSTLGSDERDVSVDMSIDCYDPLLNEWSCFIPSTYIGTDEDDIVSLVYEDNLLFHEHNRSYLGFGKLNISSRTWSLVEKPHVSYFVNCLIVANKIYAVCKDFKDQVCLYEYDFSDESWDLTNIMASVGTRSSMRILFSSVKATALPILKDNVDIFS